MVRPLTKRKKDRSLYVRPVAVEIQIAGVLRQDAATLKRRLRIQDSGSPEYLGSECLVHLVREGVRGRDECGRNDALAVLLSRCTANLRSTVKHSLPNAEDVRRSIVGDFSELLASDAWEDGCEELDFYECRFGLAFAVFRKSAVSRELRNVSRNVELPDEKGIDGYDRDALQRIATAFESPDLETGRFREELERAINYELTPEERKAVTLCHGMGYKVESTNPTEVTAATRCNCSGRTIRMRLSRAAAKLSRFKEDI